jgi:hypothetical protein
MATVPGPNMLQLPVAVSVAGNENIWLVQGGVDRTCTLSQLSGLPYVSTSRTITTEATGGLAGGGALSADLSLSFYPFGLVTKSAMVVADTFAINDSAVDAPKQVTFPNAMKALTGLSTLSVPNITNDYLVINHAADGLTYKINPSSLSLATGNVPAGGTTGQILAKASNTDYDTVWGSVFPDQAANVVLAGPSSGGSAQPAFRALVGADLPNPASSTKGGVKSYAAVTHQFLTSIATDGTPVSAQPAFTDISGTATVSQGGTGAATLTAHGVVIGNGTSAVNLASVGTSGRLFIDQGASADPSFNVLSGDATITNAGALTIANSAVTNAKLANAAAYTFKGNATGSSAAPTDFTISGLTHKASPAPTDLLLISDEASSHSTKYCTIAECLTSASVASVNGLTGALTIANGTGMAAVTAVGTTITVAVDSTVGRKSGSFVTGNLICASNTTGTYIDSGLAPISSAASGSVYSNNTTGAASPAFNTTLGLLDGSVSAPAYSYANHATQGWYYNGTSNNVAGNVVFGDLATAYKKVTIYGSSTQSLGIQSTSSASETSIFFKDASTAEWRVGANITNNNRFDIRDNTNSTGTWIPAAGSGATTWTFYSDERLKTNIQPFPSVLDRLDNYRAVSFDWAKPLRDGSTWHGTGVIAQEIHRAFPEVVHRGSDGNLTDDKDAWGVQYDRLGFIALQGVKELRDQVRALQERISLLESRA